MADDRALTKEEARTRAGVLSNVRYQVDLDLTGDGSAFTSRTRIQVDAEPGTTTFVDLVAESVEEVTVNGEPLDAAHVTPGRITLPDLQASNVIDVTATCAYDRTGVGLHRFTDPADGQVFCHTQFEPADAHRVFACFDQPDLKAPWTLTVTAPEEWDIISNDRVAGTKPGADPSAKVWTFVESAPMSTYLMAVVTGPFHKVTDTYTGPDGTEVPLGLYCRPSLAEHLDADEIFEITKQGFEEFTARFGYPYPFGKYDQLFVPEFNWGGMENVGCVTLVEKLIFRSKTTDAARQQRAEVILHELAHMWFGDLVTMRWWDDLWLNESFATYASYHALTKATRFTDAWATFASQLKGWALTQDQLPSTHPIAADMPDTHAARTNFDGITYAKGASVLKQLVAWVGEEAFFAGLRDYFPRHAYGNASLTDFLAALEGPSGRDLTAWAREWLQTSGVATVRAETTQAEGVYQSVVIHQEAAAGNDTLRSHRLGVAGYNLVDGELTRVFRHDLDVSGPQTEVPELVGTTVPDLLLLNDGDHAFVKLRLDQRSLDTLIEHLSTLEDPLTRALSWAAVWDMTRDAEIPARRFADLFAKHAAAERDLSLLHGLQQRVHVVVDVYGDPTNAPAVRQRLAQAGRQALNAAEPGSDLQLAWARFTFATVDDPADLDWLRGLLDGVAVPEGLTIDTDLRWALLSRLALEDNFDERLIDAERERDPSDIGARHAARILASRPTTPAKERAWTALTERDQPLATLRETASGFWQPRQDALLTGYLRSYVDLVGDLWSGGVTEEASELTEVLYPRTLVDQQTLDATATLIDHPKLPPPGQRIIAEGRDATARALRVRDADKD